MSPRGAPRLPRPPLSVAEPSLGERLSGLGERLPGAAPVPRLFPGAPGAVLPAAWLVACTSCAPIALLPT